ncbi:MAG: tetratricopeptide repeat protein [Zoogloea sp.]|uniref:tetratricopeptide repeat protein n=1 Tax=Zoogloea sp. TaxID=49181 RepID=UPI003F39F81D
MKPLLRSTLLIAAGAAVVGIGCVTIHVPPELDTTAQKVYLPKAEKGDTTAQLQLALAYRFGTAGVGTNPQEAWKWLKRSANGGNQEARMMVADALWRGDLGQTAQPAEALGQMRALAENGSREQQAHLGVLLEGDLGGTPNLEEAARWYEKAARRGHRYAAQRLGQFYEQGRGVSANRSTALAWYQVGQSSLDLQRLSAQASAAQRTQGEQLARQIQQEMRP